MEDKTEYWVELIFKQELPAISSTAILLNKFANDDKSSLPKLSQSIMHDQALASSVLKVANSRPNSNYSPISTISRATVVLGIHTVKNICLTAKLLDGLFKNKQLDDPVYNRLVQLMANSFYAGLLARMMVPEYDENTQEEVYLAAMLYRIGETAFWSSGSDACNTLIKHVHLDEKEFKQKCENTIGTNFHKISIGLAKKWKLGELLEKSLDNPQVRTKEMQIISLADKLSDYIGSPPKSEYEFNHLLDDICKIKHTSVPKLKLHITKTREHALQLIRSYKSSALESAIKPLPTSDDFDQEDKKENVKIPSKSENQLSLLMELTHLAKSSSDINTLIHFVIDKLMPLYRLEYCSFFMLTSDKAAIQARYRHKENKFHHQLEFIPIKLTDNLFHYVIDSGEPILINDFQKSSYRDYITETVEYIIEQGPICIVPVAIQNKNIGVIVGQRRRQSGIIEENDFSQFSFTIEHLNMCLSLVKH